MKIDYQTKLSKKKIENYVEEYEKKNKYDKLNYDASLEIVKKFENNNNYIAIFIKTTFINSAFKTAIGDIEGLAKQIYEKVEQKNINIDTMIKNKNYKVIDIISEYKVKNKEEKSKKTRNNYSFATKYCHCHDNQNFPIYDRYVRDSLYGFNLAHKFSKFYKYELKTNYKKFVEVYFDFKEFINKNSIPNGKLDDRILDRFLWAFGKEMTKK